MTNKEVNFSEIDGPDSSEFWNNLWYGLGDVRKIKTTNEMLTAEWNSASIEEMAELLVGNFRKPSYIPFFVKYILNIDLLPFQALMLDVFWHKSLPMLIASRGSSKSFMLAIYVCCRAVLQQGCRIVVVGASLRQSMVIYNYIQQIWDNAPILRDICGNKDGMPKRDLHMCLWTPGKSRVVFLPLGDGSKIRGQRANVIIADEFQSIPVEVFETVVRGFAAVKSDGMHGHVIKAYKNKKAKELGLKFVEEADKNRSELGSIDGNQIIISGTADFSFGHFYKYYRYYRAIIESGGDKKILKSEFPDMNITDNINPKDYVVFRIPYAALPLGMMDETVLNQGKATMDPIIFSQEYETIFSKDSEGFYLASWIKSCTCPIVSQNGIISFGPKVHGDRDKRYVIGVDPASEDDNFTIHIIELAEGYRGSVYQWSTNRKKFEEFQRKQVLDPTIKDYNTFVIRHLRDLVRRFSTEMIVCDAGGGGLSIREGLKDPDKMTLGDSPIYDMDDPMESDKKGSHILKMIDFASYDWRKESHWGLRKDILDRKLLFSKWDGADIETSIHENSTIGKIGDTVDDNYIELEQCKQEMILIKHSQTPTGQEKWDVPRIVGMDAEAVKRTLKKDRFTSILLANWGCRLLEEAINYPQQPAFFGGLAKNLGKETGGVDFLGGILPRVASNGNRKIYY